MSPRVRPSDIPSNVLELCQALQEHGFRAWIVGGCLRDLLRGKPASDWDLATTAHPHEVQRVFPRVFPTGIQHGTVTVRHRGHNYEVTTLRGEGAYSDGRRPDSVEFVGDIEADLARRDFTVNAMAYDPLTQQLVDPFGGLSDLAQRVIRAVGKPEERFSEDGLRVLRAARFCATLEFDLDPATEAAIRPTLATFRRVSAERVREEWLKALRANAPSRAFVIMRRTGILEVTLPELAAQPEPVFAASMRAVDRAPVDPLIRLAAVLSPLREKPARIERWLTDYRFSNAERERVLRMLTHASPEGAERWSDADVRRYAQRVGRAYLDDTILLGELLAEAEAGTGSERHAAACALRDRVRQLITPETPLVIKDLALGGRDLMTYLGMAPGPAVGRVLDSLLDFVIEQPSHNTREALLERARACLLEQERP